jgi:hypothetical protein
VSTYVTTELPNTTHGALLQAVSHGDALLTVWDRAGASTVYASIDNGATWVAVTPPLKGAAAFRLPASTPPFG